MRSMACGVLSLVFLLVLGLGSLPGQISVEGFRPKEDSFPVVGKPSMVSSEKMPKAGRLRVTYRPRSAVSHVEKIDMPNGKVLWTPQAPGIVLLEVGTMAPDEDGKKVQFKSLGKKVVSVRSQSSTLGFMIMVLAGLILFGGASISIRSLLSAE
ncbi:MAG TPA: hypothetical protein ENK02_16060 [Planctomycetes bacterium]|nr:hypothetical protein [Planctomycetota bacterium]